MRPQLPDFLECQSRQNSRNDAQVAFQRAVLGRIPEMERHRERYFRQVFLMCDEYHSFATVGESDPIGDEKFFSLSRQSKCIPIVATQSISSLKSTLSGDSYRTLLQAFDLLQALNTGHEGSLCNLHANSARQAVTRFADCVLQSGIELPHRAIMANIGSAVDLLVLIGRTKGQRAVSEIVAMRGFDNERNECTPRRSEPLRSASSTRLLRLPIQVDYVVRIKSILCY
jgi:hypothetical protein